MEKNSHERERYVRDRSKKPAVQARTCNGKPDLKGNAQKGNIKQQKIEWINSLNKIHLLPIVPYILALIARGAPHGQGRAYQHSRRVQGPLLNLCIVLFQYVITLACLQHYICQNTFYEAVQTFVSLSRFFLQTILHLIGK